MGYAAKEFFLCCLLHMYANVELGFGGLLIFRSSSVCSLVGLRGGGGLVGGLSGIGTWLVPACSNMIASSSPAAVMGMGGRCGVVGVGVPSVLDAARPCRLLISFMSSSA